MPFDLADLSQADCRHRVVPVEGLVALDEMHAWRAEAAAIAGGPAIS